MFEIKKAYSLGPNGDDLMVVDEDRDVWLQRICSIDIRGEYPGDVLKLVWEDRVIPFECPSESNWDESGNEYLVKRFQYFGGAAQAEYQAGILPYEFKDDAERREAMLLAVEAVLAYGGFYNGIEYPAGEYRVEFEGRLYTKSDFGLP